MADDAGQSARACNDGTRQHLVNVTGWFGGLPGKAADVARARGRHRVPPVVQHARERAGL